MILTTNYRGTQYQASHAGVHLLPTAHIRNVRVRHDEHANGSTLLDVWNRHSYSLRAFLRPQRQIWFGRALL